MSNYELIYTQKLDGTSINHQNIQLPLFNPSVKHTPTPVSRKVYQEFLEIDKECQQRMDAFKQEQIRFEAERQTKIIPAKLAIETWNAISRNLQMIQVKD